MPDKETRHKPVATVFTPCGCAFHASGIILEMCAAHRKNSFPDRNVDLMLATNLKLAGVFDAIYAHWDLLTDTITEQVDLTP